MMKYFLELTQKVQLQRRKRQNGRSSSKDARNRSNETMSPTHNTRMSPDELFNERQSDIYAVSQAETKGNSKETRKSPVKSRLESSISQPFLPKIRTSLENSEENGFQIRSKSPSFFIPVKKEKFMIKNDEKINVSELLNLSKTKKKQKKLPESGNIRQKDSGDVLPQELLLTSCDPALLKSPQELWAKTLYPRAPPILKPSEEKSSALKIRDVFSNQNQQNKRHFKGASDGGLVKAKPDYVKRHAGGFANIENTDFHHHLLRNMIRLHYYSTRFDSYSCNKVNQKQLESEMAQIESAMELIPFSAKALILEEGINEFQQLSSIVKKYETKKAPMKASKDQMRETKRLIEHEMKTFGGLKEQNKFLVDILRKSQENGLAEMNMEEIFKFKLLVKTRLAALQNAKSALSERDQSYRVSLKTEKTWLVIDSRKNKEEEEQLSSDEKPAKPGSILSGTLKQMNGLGNSFAHGNESKLPFQMNPNDGKFHLQLIESGFASKMETGNSFVSLQEKKNPFYKHANSRFVLGSSGSPLPQFYLKEEVGIKDNGGFPRKSFNGKVEPTSLSFQERGSEKKNFKEKERLLLNETPIEKREIRLLPAFEETNRIQGLQEANQEEMRKKKGHILVKTNEEKEDNEESPSNFHLSLPMPKISENPPPKSILAKEINSTVKILNINMPKFPSNQSLSPMKSSTTKFSGFSPRSLSETKNEKDIRAFVVDNDRSSSKNRDSETFMVNQSIQRKEQEETPNGSPRTNSKEKQSTTKSPKYLHLKDSLIKKRERQHVETQDKEESLVQRLSKPKERVSKERVDVLKKLTDDFIKRMPTSEKLGAFKSEESQPREKDQKTLLVLENKEETNMEDFNEERASEPLSLESRPTITDFMVNGNGVRNDKTNEVLSFGQKKRSTVKAGTKVSIEERSSEKKITFRFASDFNLFKGQIPTLSVDKSTQNKAPSNQNRQVGTNVFSGPSIGDFENLVSSFNTIAITREQETTKTLSVVPKQEPLRRNSNIKIEPQEKPKKKTTIKEEGKMGIPLPPLNSAELLQKLRKMKKIHSELPKVTKKEEQNQTNERKLSKEKEEEKQSQFNQEKKEEPSGAHISEESKEKKGSLNGKESGVPQVAKKSRESKRKAHETAQNQSKKGQKTKTEEEAAIDEKLSQSKKEHVSTIPKRTPKIPKASEILKITQNKKKASDAYSQFKKKLEGRFRSNLSSGNSNNQENVVLEEKDQEALNVVINRTMMDLGKKKGGSNERRPGIFYNSGSHSSQEDRIAEEIDGEGPQKASEQIKVESPLDAINSEMKSDEIEAPIDSINILSEDISDGLGAFSRKRDSSPTTESEYPFEKDYNDSYARQKAHQGTNKGSKDHKQETQKKNSHHQKKPSKKVPKIPSIPKIEEVEEGTPEITSKVPESAPVEVLTEEQLEEIRKKEKAEREKREKKEKIDRFLEAVNDAVNENLLNQPDCFEELDGFFDENLAKLLQEDDKKLHFSTKLMAPRPDPSFLGNQKDSDSLNKTGWSSKADKRNKMNFFSDLHSESETDEPPRNLGSIEDHQLVLFNAQEEYFEKLKTRWRRIGVKIKQNGLEDKQVQENKRNLREFLEEEKRKILGKMESPESIARNQKALKIQKDFHLFAKEAMDPKSKKSILSQDNLPVFKEQPKASRKRTKAKSIPKKKKENFLSEISFVSSSDSILEANELLRHSSDFEDIKQILVSSSNQAKTKEKIKKNYKEKLIDLHNKKPKAFQNFQKAINLIGSKAM